jgi:topoisomerase IV subunit B
VEHGPDEACTATHDWARAVDLEHLARIRRKPEVFAPRGALHLVLEVLAYAAEEAACTGSGRGVVTLHRDGSLAVADNGRGTDTRVGGRGPAVRKPVMSTKDLRFFDSPGVAVLPDGHFRRGISVVAALSRWLVHVNRRLNGSWTQRYELGIPVTDLTPIPNDGSTGTTVHFVPAPTLVPDVQVPAAELRQMAAAFGPHLRLDIHDER